jgi:hypothetical protein
MFELPIFQHAIPTLIWLGIEALLYTVVLGIWRLYFSPIAKFPGPKIAALTYRYAVQVSIIYLPPLVLINAVFCFISDSI